ncbi:MAG TPA: trimeric intracellular cation channel family protein [Solirubrobacterales bacterium]|nr:trimeric intracellular cation channel family protein [Solirubrobacterales bacterium]
MEVAELLGTVVFAISGVIAVAEHRLDWFGAVVVGVVTAIGGGTMRGLILGETPVFWIEDEIYLAFAIAGGILAIPLVIRFGSSHTRFEEGLRVADALGLALFAIVGASVTLDLGFDGTTAVVCGILTGVGGGVIRDLLAGQTTPLILRSEIYATAALAGTILFVLLVEVTDMTHWLASAAGMLTILALRMAGIKRDWRLPTLR